MKNQADSRLVKKVLLMFVVSIGLAISSLITTVKMSEMEYLIETLTQQNEFLEDQDEVLNEAIITLTDYYEDRIVDLEMALDVANNTELLAVSVDYGKPNFALETELDMLAMVIYQEAGGDAADNTSRVMVGNVVMNRVSDPRFPDTLEEVLLQEGQYGRLSWTGLQWPDRALNEPAAVERAYLCAQAVLDGIQVLGPEYIWQAEFEQGSNIVYRDGHYFGT